MSKALVLLKQAISITILWQWSQGKWPCYDYHCSHYQLKQFADITEKKVELFFRSYISVLIFGSCLIKTWYISSWEGNECCVRVSDSQWRDLPTSQLARYQVTLPQQGQRIDQGSQSSTFQKNGRFRILVESPFSALIIVQSLFRIKMLLWDSEYCPSFCSCWVQSHWWTQHN